MTEAVSAPTVSRRRRYRGLLFGAVVVGSVLGVGLRVLGYPIVGEAVYWVGILAFLGVWRFTPVTLFDERDAELERRASNVTLVVAAVALVVGASAARLASVTGAFEVPATVSGALYGYVALFVVFALALGYTKLAR
ncbi:DUF2178 domain-containing protein [Halobaculum litoreum]|uniref:DUF2178 domain-containing protein n=1 Tax=Halobaculum litoreum TaxID=3031998 RepID=A0ABD5XPL9_9EURY|nr:DUF2178 domain-containing protein [Halobaculum sp. DT92]